MTFAEKIKRPEFWMITFKIAFTFFVILVVLSLLFNSFSAIIDIDLQTIIDENLSDGKWVRFFGVKILVALIYAIWTTARNTK